jgi:hypothetical protein
VTIDLACCIGYLAPAQQTLQRIPLSPLFPFSPLSVPPHRFYHNFVMVVILVREQLMAKIKFWGVE